MEKLTYEQLLDKFYKFNEEHKIEHQFDQPSLIGVVVFKASNWEKEYPLDARSYAFSSSNKAFIPGMGGNSIFASSIDGQDVMIRLDYYLSAWEIDYCYIQEPEI